jgi:hypothetical protein
MSQEIEETSTAPKCVEEVCEDEQVVLEKKVDAALGELERLGEFQKDSVVEAPSVPEPEPEPESVVEASVETFSDIPSSVPEPVVEASSVEVTLKKTLDDTVDTVEKVSDVVVHEVETLKKSVEETVDKALDETLETVEKVSDVVVDEAKILKKTVDEAVDKAVDAVSELVVREVETLKKTWVQKLVAVVTQIQSCIPRLSKVSTGSEPTQKK